MASRAVTLRALVIVTLFGLIWAHALGLTQFVNPSSIDWMLEGDWMQSLFGWLFTRNARWGLPFAQAPDLLAPGGTSAAFSDAIPILSAVGKLVSPFFGERMQLFGVWMVSQLVGAGVAGVLVCRQRLRDTPSLALAGCLFVMNPIVSARFGHPSLMAFWLLTALVGVSLWEVAQLTSLRRTAMITLLLCFLSCGVHPYLAAMCALLAGASLVRLALTRHATPLESVAWLAAGPLVCVAGAWLFGYLAPMGATPVGSLTAEGFGQFSADTLALFNPGTWSRFFGPIPTNARQYEGFAYLGLGTFGLLGLGLALLVKQGPARRQLLLATPLLFAVVVMTVYSFSNLVTIAGTPLANFTSFYERLAPWPSVFRGSGRFIWPLAALLTTIAVFSAARLGTPWVRHFVLGGAVLLQLADFDPARSGLHKAYPPLEPLRDPAWQLMKDYRHVVVHPIQLQWICPFDGKFVAALSWEVYRQQLTINSGHVTRAPRGTDCKHQLQLSELDPQTVYVMYFPEYAGQVLPSLACGGIEGKLVCVTNDRDTPLRRALLARSQPR